MEDLRTKKVGTAMLPFILFGHGNIKVPNDSHRTGMCRDHPIPVQKNERQTLIVRTVRVPPRACRPSRVLRHAQPCRAGPECRVMSPGSVVDCTPE